MATLPSTRPINVGPIQCHALHHDHSLELTNWDLLSRQQEVKLARGVMMYPMFSVADDVFIAAW